MFEYLHSMKKNISFKSQIHIVTSEKFKKIVTNKSIYYCNYGKFKNIVKANSFSTTGIKTCTGGILTTKDKTTAVGFHFWDALTLEELISNIKNLKNANPTPTNIFLIGSKELSTSKNSIHNFNKLHNELSNICSNISYFKTFTKEYGSSDFKYDATKDTIYVLVKDIVKKQGFDKVKEILSLKKLKNFFKEIYIAPTDTLFINGEKVNISDAPEFFTKKL